MVSVLQLSGDPALLTRLAYFLSFQDIDGPRGHRRAQERFVRYWRSQICGPVRARINLGTSPT